MEVRVRLPSFIDDTCMKITQCQSRVMVGSSPAHLQCPYNPTLLQVQKGGALGRCPCVAALA